MGNHHYTLHSGLKFKLAKDINPAWNDYQSTTAKIHLANCGWIILDEEYEDPIDNEYDLKEIYTMIEVEILEKKESSWMI